MFCFSFIERWSTSCPAGLTAGVPTIAFAYTLPIDRATHSKPVMALISVPCPRPVPEIGVSVTPKITWKIMERTYLVQRRHVYYIADARVYLICSQYTNTSYIRIASNFFSMYAASLVIKGTVFIAMYWNIDYWYSCAVGKHTCLSVQWIVVIILQWLFYFNKSSFQVR